jgi:serine protease Do
MEQPRVRRGGAAGVLLLGLIGGVIGSLLTNLVTNRGGQPSSPVVRPYTEVVNNGPPPSVGGGASVVQAVQKIGPAVVFIDTTFRRSPDQSSGLPDLFRRFFGGAEPQEPMPAEGRGSGFIINGSRGYIVTNNHVVSNARSIHVTLPDKRAFDAQTIGTDPFADVALIRIPGRDLPELKFADSDKLAIGMTAIAIGNPFGFENSVTTGVVSAVKRELRSPSGVPLENLIQTDAAINPGNSGGPLCDLNANVMAMNTAIIPYGQGIGFAVASNTIKRSIDDILKYGHAVRPWIGITYLELTRNLADQLGIPNANGVVIRNVISNSPAERAGLRPGDVVTEINGATVKETNDLRKAIRDSKPGQTITLTVWREKETLKIPVRLGEMPPPSEQPEG